MKHLIVIEGPTASGKTALGIALAKHYKTCVVSADSRQFYKELSIGTAKPSLAEQDGIVHHFVDSHSIEESLSSAQYEKEALNILESEFERADFVILVGGSGMFIDALCNGLDPIPSSIEMREKINNEFEENGLGPLLEELQRNDPEYYNEVDQKNPMRIIRAIEVIRLSGVPYSIQRNKQNKTPRPFLVHRFVIHHDREKLYKRINERVDMMMSDGLLDEVKSLVEYKTTIPLNTVGYKELFQYLDGTISLPDAVDKIKTNTRRYAKRQLTWFRGHANAVWIDFEETKQMVQVIVSSIESNSKP